MLICVNTEMNGWKKYIFSCHARTRDKYFLHRLRLSRGMQIACYLFLKCMRDRYWSKTRWSKIYWRKLALRGKYRRDKRQEGRVFLRKINEMKCARRIFFREKRSRGLLLLLHLLLASLHRRVAYDTCI